MGYKVVLVENDVNMSIRLNNVIINRDGHDIWVSVDDISVLVIDNMKVNITARMLSYLAEHNVGIILCDAKHLPIGYYGGIIELVYIVLQSVVKPGITGFFKIDLHIKCYIYLS